MNQKGQTLVITVIVMLVALSASILIASRYFKSLKTFTKSDNANKAQYVAESLAERLLSLSSETLGDFVTNNSCDSNCYLNFPDGSQAYAEILPLGNSSDTHEIKIIKDTTVQINLEGYSGSYIDICWNENSSIEAMYLDTTYTVESYAYNSMHSTYPSNFDVADPNYSYNNCFRVNNTGEPLLLNLKSLYENSYVYLLPESGAILPLQGYLIKITGRFLDISRVIEVAKRFTVSPDIFDYVLYQTSGESSLSK